MDWTLKGAVPPIQNRRSCTSYWLFDHGFLRGRPSIATAWKLSVFLLEGESATQCTGASKPRPNTLLGQRSLWVEAQVVQRFALVSCDARKVVKVLRTRTARKTLHKPRAVNTLGEIMQLQHVNSRSSQIQKAVVSERWPTMNSTTVSLLCCDREVGHQSRSVSVHPRSSAAETLATGLGETYVNGFVQTLANK